MPDRYCEGGCGSKMMPRWPRQRVNGKMLCPLCAQNEVRQVPRTAASDSGRHPDLDWKLSTFGVANTSLGRAGYGARRRTAASFHDPEGWKRPGSLFEPAHDAVAGARAFASERGLRDPHEHEFRSVMQTKDRVSAIGRHYDKMADFDKSAVPHFESMRHEVNAQHDFMTKRMGVKFEAVDHDPYSDVHEMVHDVKTNKRIKVMSTRSTGAHPFFSDEENDKFRAVHDLFGHAATGRDFSRHGEEAAFQAHSRMFSPHARRAMASETRGQNASLIMNGQFSRQKIGLLPAHLSEESSMDRGQRVAVRVARGTLARSASTQQKLVHTVTEHRGIVRVAHDSGDGETIFHCPFCGSGQVVARSDGAIDCDFCKNAFTVQVQPTMPAFPQTVNGMPIDVPGMPGGGANAAVPPDEAAAAGYPPPTPGQGAPGEDPEGEGEEPEDDSGGGENPFAKQSLYTSAGRQVSVGAFQAWLALQYTPDRARTLQRARQRQARRS